MKKFIVLIGVIFISFSLYWIFHRQSPLEKGKKLLTRGDVGGAIEVLYEALNQKEWGSITEEDLRVELARAYLLKGAVGNAEKEFQYIAKNFRRNGYAYLGLGFINLSKGQDTFAAEYFQEALKKDPTDLRAHLGLAGLYTFRSEFEKAQQEYLIVLNKVPTDRVARHGLAQSYLLSGRFREAILEFENILGEVPGNTSMRISLARAFMLSGEVKRAEQEVRNVLNKEKENTLARTLLGEIFETQGNWKEAKSQYETIYNEDRHRVLPGIRLLYCYAYDQEWVQMRALHDQLQKFIPPLDAQVPTFFSSFHEIWDTLRVKNYIRQINVDFNRTMARVYFLQGLYSDAERRLNQALEINSKDLRSLRSIIQLHRLRKEPEEHWKWAQRALKIYPNHPYLFMDIARIAMILRKKSDQLVFAQAAMDACPQLLEANSTLLRVFLNLKNSEKAEEILITMFEINPSHYWTQLSLGYFERKYGDQNKSKEGFLKAVEQNPFSAEAYYQLGQILKKQKKIEKATVYLNEAARLEPMVYSKN